MLVFVSGSFVLQELLSGDAEGGLRDVLLAFLFGLVEDLNQLVFS